VPLLQFLLLWAVWERYLIPLLPQCAVLVTVALDRIPRAVRLRRLALVGVAALGLVPLALALTGVHAFTRGASLFPDTRPYDGLTRVLARAPRGETVLVVDESHYVWGRSMIPARPRNELVEVPDADNPFGANDDQVLHHLLWVTPTEKGLLERVAWWEQIGRELLPLLSPVAESTDPDGMRFRLYRFPRPVRVSALLSLAQERHAGEPPRAERHGAR